MSNIGETAYERIDGTDYCLGTASAAWSIRMFRRLNDEFPDKVTIMVENKDGSLVVRFPYAWFPKIRAKKKRNTTEAERKAKAERLAIARAKKSQK